MLIFSQPTASQITNKASHILLPLEKAGRQQRKTAVPTGPNWCFAPRLLNASPGQSCTNYRPFMFSNTINPRKELFLNHPCTERSFLPPDRIHSLQYPQNFMISILPDLDIANSLPLTHNSGKPDCITIHVMQGIHMHIFTKKRPRKMHRFKIPWCNRASGHSQIICFNIAQDAFFLQKTNKIIILSSFAIASCF